MHQEPLDQIPYFQQLLQQAAAKGRMLVVQMEGMEGLVEVAFMELRLALVGPETRLPFLRHKVQTEEMHH